MSDGCDMAVPLVRSGLYPGKQLTEEEDAGLRRTIGLAIRVGDKETAANLERFLPENVHRWTLDEELASLSAPRLHFSE